MENYFETLDEAAKARYNAKINCIGKQDPYKIEKGLFSSDPKLFPDVRSLDLVNYLIFHPSPFYTLKDFQNYKSLDAYDRFVCGWVRDVSVYVYDVEVKPIHVIRARVMHSQRMNATSLTPWILCNKDGQILSAHCDCMAGLGESCSHIASVLFYIEAAVRLREVTTVTQKPAYWMLPASRKGVEYSPLFNINFTSAKVLKKMLDNKIQQHQTAITPSTVTSCSKPSTVSTPCLSSAAVAPCMSSTVVTPCLSSTAVAPCMSSTVVTPCKPSTVVTPCMSSTVVTPCKPSTVVTPCKQFKEVKQPSDVKWDKFFAAIKVDKPACLAVDRRYNACYTPRPLQKKYPLVLSELYDETQTDLNYQELLLHCETLISKITVTPLEIQAVESDTKEQANSKLWFKFRTGRITASKAKAVCSTTTVKPSMSLLKSICYPTEVKFSNAATRWGCDHEKTARLAYEKQSNEHHSNVQIECNGLFLSVEYPYFGASPDGLVSCECCGQGCIEIKCPYCMREGSVRDGKDSCLETLNGHLELKKNHPYYFQVQTQLLVTGFSYCDFVMWTDNDLFVQRVTPSVELWHVIDRKCSTFFKTVVLPELVSKHYSREVEKQGSGSVLAMPISEKNLPLTHVETQNTKSVVVLGDSTHKANISCKASRKTVKTGTCTKKRARTEEEDVSKYCICDGNAKDLRMVGCDSEECPHKPYEWFHFSCMKLKRDPVGDWFCMDCREVEAVKHIKQSTRRSRVKSSQS